MAKNKRHYVPCRECGVTHNNNASSSICNECGPAYALKNRITKEEARQEEKARLEEEWVNEHGL
mgnify:CR=1 FL=1